MGDMAEGILNGDFDEETGEYIGPGQGFQRRLNRDRKNEIPEAVGKIQKLLIDNGYVITVAKKIDYGFQMRTASGAIVNVYTSGKVSMQGKLDDKLKQLIK